MNLPSTATPSPAVQPFPSHNVAIALAYSRKHFPQYARLSPATHLIPQLMAAAMYSNDWDTSPYQHIRYNRFVTEVEREVVRFACDVYGVAPESPLQQVTEAAAHLLPDLLKLQRVLRGRGEALPGYHDEEIPVEVDLPNHLRFHTVFACPVSRSEAHPNNPPMLLKCGHVVSKESLEGIAGTRARLGLH